MGKVRSLPREKREARDVTQSCSIARKGKMLKQSLVNPEETVMAVSCVAPNLPLA